MLFSQELRDDVLAGEITVSFRLWKRPKVKTGGRYPVGPGQGLIEVDSIELIRREVTNMVQGYVSARVWASNFPMLNVTNSYLLSASP